MRPSIQQTINNDHIDLNASPVPGDGRVGHGRNVVPQKERLNLALKVFLIGGGGDQAPRGIVYSYRQHLSSKLYRKITELGTRPFFDVSVDVRFLTHVQAQHKFIEKKINKISDRYMDELYVAIIGHSWGGLEGFVIAAHKHIKKLNTLILIDPVGHGFIPLVTPRAFDKVVSKIGREHFKVKFINFTDYELDKRGSGNGISFLGGRWDVGIIGRKEQGNSTIYRKLTQLGYSKYDLLSNVKCNHADFVIMFEQYEDWLFNDIEKFIKKAYCRSLL